MTGQCATGRAEQSLDHAAVARPIMPALCSKRNWMPYRMNPQQYESVLALSSADRSTHFVGKVADWQQLWGVRNDEGWLVPTTPDDLEYFPVWPHPEYAHTIVDEHFPGHYAVEISLDEFLSHWLPTFEDDGVQVAVFPNKEWVFWVMEPKDLEQCLRDELALYE